MPEKLPRPGDVPDAPLPAHVRVAIVGAGFGGIGTAVRLRQDGERDVVLLERALYRRVPMTQRVIRRLLAAGREVLLLAFRRPALARLVQRLAYVPPPRATDEAMEPMVAGARP